MPRQQQQQQESSLLVDMRTSFNILVFLADVHTACIRPFTRCGMGTRPWGAPGVGALLLIPAYAGMAGSRDMITYWYLWIAMVVYRRWTCEPFQHPHYQGRVWMFHWCMRREIHARLMEAGTMHLLGGILCGISEPVGMFVAAGLFSFGVRYVVDAGTEARRREAVLIARREMEAMQEYLRSDDGR